MPTTIKTQIFNTLTAANPYVIGSAPDNLVGYALTTGSDPVKIFNTGSHELILASGTRAILYDTTYMTGVTIRSTIKMGNVNGNNRGGGVVDAAANGDEVYHTIPAGTTDVNSFSSSVTANAGDASLNLQGAYSAYLGTHGAEVSI